jgi:hypothetical protein
MSRWATFLIVVALGVVLTVLLRRHPSGAAAPADTTPVAHGPVPTLGSSTPSTLTESDPFQGSPAASFADGAAGIVMPPARALPGYPAAQVARAYRITKRMLIAASLDPKTLQGGSPDAFARLLTTRERTFFVHGLDHIGLDKRGYLRSTRGWVTSFAPGTTQFDSDVVKVHGVMAARVAAEKHAPLLRVHANYLFVYPVQQPGRPATLMRIVVHAVVNVDFAHWDDAPGGPLEPWWNGIGWGTAGGRCDVNDGFVHPAFPSSAAEKVTPSGAPVDPYDLSAPPGGSGCRATTGT